MKQIIEKFSNELKSCLNKEFLAVSIDGQFINEYDSNTFFGDTVIIYLSNNFSVKISTNDIPHFYGEGDLELEFASNDEIKEPVTNFKHKPISQIKLYGWKRNGLNLFKVSTYFVQIEFFFDEELLLSSGFFYFDQITNKVECLITGELSVDFQNGILISAFDKNLSVMTIA
jgi:hypothetical protein